MITNYLNSLTVEDFKDYFKREFHDYFMPYWDEYKYYKKDDIAFLREDETFYTSLKNRNTDHPSNEESWEVNTEKNKWDYITDEDIEKAFIQARGDFPYNKFSSSDKDKDTAKMLYMLLTAHNLLKDLQMSNSSIANGFLGDMYVSSKTVGDVSASYQIPSWLLDDPVISYLGSTKFGMKYIHYAYNLSLGVFYHIPGRTNSYFH